MNIRNILRCLFVLFLLILNAVYFNSANAQCSSSTSGSTQTAVNTGVSQTWTENASAYVHVNSPSYPGTYLIKSSTGTDYITIRTGSASSSGTVIASGTTPLTFSTTSTSSFYVIVDSTSWCTTSNVNRTITMAMKPSITSIPASACAGSVITITGAALSGVTAISVNGTSASTYTIVSSTSISLTLPVAATTGTITVTGPGGTATSSSITINANPTNSNPTPATDTICPGNSASIILPSSQTGISYQLRNNSGNTAVGSAVSGTGLPLIFSTGTLYSSVTYNILATNTTTNCAVQMTGTSAVVTSTSISVGSPLSICESFPVAPVTLTGVSVSGKTTTGAWSIVTGTGTLSNTAQTSSPAAVTYTPVTGDTTTSTLAFTVNPVGCLSITLNQTVTINPIPTPTVTTNFCISGVAFKVTVNSASSYYWSNGATTQSILDSVASLYNVTVTNSYGCTASAVADIGGQLVVNGDFSSGNTGFTSAYIDSQTNLIPEGLYAITANAHNQHPNFWGTAHDHPGTGVFMAINGAPSSIAIWSETVTVQPNTTYYFSAYAMSLDQVTPYAILQFHINGTGVGNALPLAAGANSLSGPFNWQRIYTTWNSGSSTSAKLEIFDTCTVRNGNDFGLDDISFSLIPTTPISVTVSTNAPVCPGSTITLNATPANAIYPVTYSWSGPASFSSSTQANSISNASTIDTGAYTVKVTDAHGCSATSSGSVSVYAAATINAVATPAVICNSGSTNIVITGSVSGINYRLYNASTNAAIGSAVAGTGGTINLPTGNLTATTSFTVTATNTTTSCITTFPNVTTVTVSNPAAPLGQPTNLLLTLTGIPAVGSGVDGSFVAPVNLSNLQGYVVARCIATTQPATTNPTNNTTYVSGNTLGAWTVVSVIYDATAGTKYFVDTLPTGNCGKNVYYEVFALDTQYYCVTYNTTSPPTNNIAYIPIYYWNRTVSADYTVSTNWTPNRLSVQACDILYVANGGTDTLVNVPATETIAQLNIQGNSTAVLQPAGGTTAYTFSGNNSITNGLNIQAGATLDVGTGVTCSFSATGMSAVIGGTLRTANVNGLSGAAGSTITSVNSPTTTLSAGCTIVYEATSGTQVVTSRSDYQNITFINNATKNFAGNVLTAGTGNTVTITGGIVDALTYSLSQANPTNLTMTGGTLRQAKLATILPQLTGTYSLTAGTVELYGTGNQILKGSTTYYNLLFSGKGTCTLSSAISTGTNEINGNVNILPGDTLDVQAYRFGSPVTTFNMTGGKFRTSHTGDVVPMMGSTYALTGGTVELYGTTCIDSQILRSAVTYYNVNITAVNGNFVTGNVKQNTGTITISSGATFYINSPAIYNIDGNSLISGAGGFSMTAGSGLFYGSQYGITAASCGTGVTCGNILTTTRSYLPGTSGFLWSTY